MQPSFNIFRNAKTGSYTILNYTVEKKFGMRVACGDLLRLTAEELNADPWRVVLEGLANFGSGDAEQRSEIEKLDPAARSRFHRDHTSITVAGEDDGSITIYPVRRSGGGTATGVPNAGIKVGLSASKSELLASLEMAFLQCE